MSCMLCLEVFKDPLSIINIYAQETTQNIAEIITMHFWLKPDAEKNNSICTSCWSSLSTFHAFYVRIQQCQQLLAQAAEAATADIKIELGQEEILEQNEATETEIFIKAAPKRRGRPPGSTNQKKKLKKCKTTNSVLNEDEIMPIKHSLRNSKLNLEVTDITVKTELEDENIINNTETLSNEETRNKSTFKDKTEISRKHDAFIAAHFRLNCSLCEQPLDNFDHLKRHFRADHKIRGYSMCCDKKFLKRGLLVDHLNVHQNPRYFACMQCDKVLADRYSLDNHTKIKHGEERERSFQCEVCSKSFFSRTIYERHMLLHVPEEQKTFICPECNKPFASNSTLRDHMRFVHLLKNSNVCDVCGKLVRGGLSALQRHQLEHTSTPREPVSCHLCGLTLTTKYGLVRHIKRLHTEENRQPIQCPFCVKISPSLSAHQHHIKFVHRMQRKHACNMCDKAFKRPRDLKEHMTTHTGEVLYTCPHCPKTFNSHANMHSHRKKMHRKEWEANRLQKYRLNNPEPELTTTVASAT